MDIFHPEACIHCQNPTTCCLLCFHTWLSKQVDILPPHHPWNLRHTTAPWRSNQPPLHPCSDWKELCYHCRERPLRSSYLSRWPRPYETNGDSCLWIYLFSESHCSSATLTLLQQHEITFDIIWKQQCAMAEIKWLRQQKQALTATHLATDYTTKAPPTCNGTG